jgi:hypothetical protein
MIDPDPILDLAFLVPTKMASLFHGKTSFKDRVLVEE